MSQRAIFSLFLMFLVWGCDDPNTQSNTCQGSKCDFTERPQLTPFEGTLGSCELEADTSTTDPFFQRDPVRCRFVNLDPPGVGSITTLGVNIVAANGDEVANVFITDTSELNGAPFEVGSVSGDQYPITVNVTAIHGLVLSQGGLFPDLDSTTSDTRYGYTHTFQARPADLDSVTFPVFFGVWPVVLWPSAELSSSWGEGSTLEARIEYTFPVTSADLIIGGADAVSEMRYRLDGLGLFPNTSDIGVLTQRPLYLPVPLKDSSFNTTLDIALELGADAVSSPIEGPGYYVIHADGSVVRTDADKLPAVAITSTPDAVDDASDVTEDATPEDAVVDTTPEEDTAPPPDPCSDMCDLTTEVCVAAACVKRSEQTQSNLCNAPQKACDDGEDGDCADDHACVAGLCRRLSCQTQSNLCNAPNRPCDGDDNADCATDHVCVAGECRRLSCQTQSNLCNAANRPCDSDDADCAADHTCSGDLCVRNSCL